MTPNDDLIKIYEECSNGYHKVDDFRAKLLGFLPLASGIAIFGTLYEIKPESTNVLSDNYVAIGIFGMLVTLGLLIYELKGITKCTQFIFLGEWIERKMEGNQKIEVENNNNFIKVSQGYFMELSRGSIGKWVITEPVATAIIYSTVISAWVYVILLKNFQLRYIIPAMVFLFFFAFIYTYWRIVLKKIKAAFEDIQKTKDSEEMSKLDDSKNKHGYL